MQVLEAWLEGNYTGRFTRADDGRVQFTYDDDATAVVSLSLPRDGSWTRNAPKHFLENLLPDRPETRARMARDSGATSPGTFELLEKVGGDIAGGLVLTPEGVDPDVLPSPIIPASDDEIAYRIDLLKRDSDLWLDPKIKTRFSLAGSQAKFALAQLYGQWYWSSPSLPSTHVLKPGSPATPLAEEIEVASMRLSALSGIPTPDAAIIEVLGQTAYIVDRFDRDRSEPVPRRIHVEDFAQAAGISSDHKYRMAAHQAVALLRRADPSDELGYQFIERLAFNTAIANADAHAKNYSLLIRPDGILLAPAYDVLVTSFWPQVDQRLAMKIGGADRSAQVTPHHWAKQARSASLETERVVEVARRVSHAVLENFDEAFEIVPPEPKTKLREIIEQANSRMR